MGLSAGKSIKLGNGFADGDCGHNAAQCAHVSHFATELFMDRVKLKAKLGIGFGALLLVLAVTVFVSYRAFIQLDALTNQVEDRSRKLELARAIEASVMKESSGIRGFLLLNQESMLDRVEQGKREYKESADAIRQKLRTEDGKRLFDEIDRLHESYSSYVGQEISAQRVGKHKEALDILTNQTGPVSRDLSKAIEQFVKNEQSFKKQAVEEQNVTEARARNAILLLAVAGVVAGVLVAALTARSITSAIAAMLHMAQQIADNNLALEDLEIKSRDEIGKAGTALNQMKNNLREVIRSIAGTAEHVASASEEISSAAAQQAKSAEIHKDQTTQVATSLQQMAATVLQVSENSTAAADASRRAAEVARDGGTIVEETLSKMRAIADSVSSTAKKVEELGKSSDQIGRIVSVINDIADQTNLLALNAAIEAARAGEQGRGFAVVADEVRKLAERTTLATKEIAEMIRTVQQETKITVSAMEQGTREVQDGVNTTARAGDSLKQIIQMSEEVGEMITHIAAAATEQSSATEEINTNMDQIAKLVKESAIGAQQSAQACQDLSGLALDLQKLVSNFKIENGVGRTPTRHEGQTSRAFSASAGRW
jgi:methyl-accepting chemotaxis protein